MPSEQDGSGAMVRRYIWGPGQDEPLVQYDGNAYTDAPQYLHADERGSIVAVSNEQSNVITTNTYDEYGIPGPNNQGLFQYTGQMWLKDIGLYHYKARAYSPYLGRFLHLIRRGMRTG